MLAICFESSERTKVVLWWILCGTVFCITGAVALDHYTDFYSKVAKLQKTCTIFCLSREFQQTDRQKFCISFNKIQIGLVLVTCSSSVTFSKGK